MQQRTMELIYDAALAMGHEFVDKRPDYSGRGMYGAKTCAITADKSPDLVACAAYAAFMLGETGSDSTAEEFIEDLKGMRQDNMGRGTVFY